MGDKKELTFCKSLCKKPAREDPFVCDYMITAIMID